MDLILIFSLYVMPNFLLAFLCAMVEFQKPNVLLFYLDGFLLMTEILSYGILSHRQTILNISCN